MKKITYFIFILTIGFISDGCKKSDRLDHIDDSAPAPKQVSGVTVQNVNGGAKLLYKLPTDVNIAYVKATYEIQPGVVLENKASIYTDTLLLEGFADTIDYQVKLYSIGKNEKISEPVIIKIRPLISPLMLAFKDVRFEPGFGGVKVSIKNDLQASLAIVVDADTANIGVMRPLRTFYTKTAAGTFSVRGLNSIERDFSVYLRDRWGNKSPVIKKKLIPIFEKLVPKPFGTFNLPGDQSVVAGTNYMTNMWDGKADLLIYASSNNTPIPQWFTFDLKSKVVISRMKEHQRTPSFTYTGANVKSFELWGSNNPTSDGSWANWNLIGSFESYKPSGLPVGTNTAEDNAYGYTNGEDFEMPDIPSPPAYQYIRFKTTATWGGTGQVTISELTFWGTF